MIDVPMPQLGESVAEGTVTQWTVREGDWVSREQVLLVVATDKADAEITAPSAGRVAKLMVPAGQLCAVGQVMVVIETAGSAAAHAAPAAPAASHSQVAAASAPAAVVTAAAPAGKGGKVLATPATRQLARNLGIDLCTVGGTGPNGRITKEDVRAVVERKSAPAPVVAAPSAPPAPPKPVATPASTSKAPAAPVKKPPTQPAPDPFGTGRK